MSAHKIVALAIVMSLGLGTADAHPALKSAVPAANGVVGPPVKDLRFIFSEEVVPAFSGATLTDGRGKIVVTGAPRLDGKNKNLLIVPIKGTLAEGKYKLAWHAVAADTHRLQGSYAFTVKK